MNLGYLDHLDRGSLVVAGVIDTEETVVPVGPIINRSMDTNLPLPTEIRLMIWEELFPEGIKPARGSTAALSTCKAVYEEAHPVFLANCLFDCTPVPVNDRLTSTGYKYFGGSISIVRYDICENPGSHLHCQKWLDTARSELSKIFETKVPQNDPTGQDDRSEQVGRHAEEAEAELDEAQLLTKAYLFRSRELYDTKLRIMSCEEHSRFVIRELIRHNSLAQAIRCWGSARSALIRNVRILWTECTDQFGGDKRVAPSAVGLMSLLCQAALPGITQVHLRHKRSSFTGPVSDCFCGLTRTPEFVKYRFADDDTFMRKIIMGQPFQTRSELNGQGDRNFVFAIHMLVDVSKKLKRLEFEDWHRCIRNCWIAPQTFYWVRIPDKWYEDILPTQDIKVVMKSKYPIESFQILAPQ
ncbi:hypothetical protein BT63DRAFT_454374 [Microthyrium microscopicum]|uniref:Uncharacterized protein n=1 Tax=Microthyrium microscopicum TaxID=703497 RepID=A0A6A6UDF5_9PEZI|nr:hypothetical protein BT63DRAFT_454374 [Microthyrium microscopicum]